MHISLIGMSGIGKTYWSKKMESMGFIRYVCNDVINRKLAHELKKDGPITLHDVAVWMGQPYDDRYEQTSKRFLELEEEAMREIMDEVRHNDKSSVIDTTGSVIYLHHDILHTLSNLTATVLLDTPPEVKEEMYQRFLKDPKPIIWGDMFAKFRGESNEVALARSYHDLLEYRSKQYKKHAHITMDYYMVQDERFTPELFLEHIKSYISE